MAGVPAVQPNAAQANQILEAIAAGLRVVLTSPRRVEPGQAVTASLVPGSPVVDATDLVTGVLNIAWTAKDVKFPDANEISVPEAGDLAGDTLAGATGADSPDVLTDNQVTGTLGQVFGTGGPPNLKVRLDVHWIVRDQDGTELAEENRDFIAQSGLASPDVSIVLPPIFAELRLDTAARPPTEVVCLSARVTLTLGEHPPLTTELGPIPVVVLPLLIPTVVALFSEPGFGVTGGGDLPGTDVSFDGSACLIMVPEHSPLSNVEPLVKVLRKVEGVVDALSSVGGFASFLLGLGALTDAIPEQPRIRFLAANEISDLDRVILKKRPWYHFFGKDPNFDDKVQSLIVLGLPGTKVEFYNDEDFKTTESTPSSTQGYFVLEVGPELFAAIRTLDTDDDVRPITLPPNKVGDFEPDEGGDGLWHTDMTSIRFDHDWLVEVEHEPPALEPELECAPPREAGTRPALAAPRTVRLR